jgi:hypothetical protein
LTLFRQEGTNIKPIGTFQILTLFWQGANIKPLPPKIEICWLPLVSYNKAMDSNASQL